MVPGLVVCFWRSHLSRTTTNCRGFSMIFHDFPIFCAWKSPFPGLCTAASFPQSRLPAGTGRGEAGAARGVAGTGVTPRGVGVTSRGVGESCMS